MKSGLIKKSVITRGPLNRRSVITRLHCIVPNATHHMQLIASCMKIARIVTFTMDDVLVAASVISSLVLIRKRRRQGKNRTIWIKQWIRNREQYGTFNCFISELRVGDMPSFGNFMRMNSETFDELLNMVAPLVAKKATSYRKAVRCAEKLAFTLRFLATGKN